MTLLAQLIQNSQRFQANIFRSVNKCCGCCRLSTTLFGRSDQANRILSHSFDGKHFFVDGPDGNRIDCMFFPCTQKEEVKVYDKRSLVRTSHAINGSLVLTDTVET